MDREVLHLTSLAILNTVAVSALAALNENRLDVYLSVFALIYFTLLAIFRPRRRGFDFLAVALLAIFSYVVAMRILEVLIKP